jgi:hypothetical protein
MNEAIDQALAKELTARQHPGAKNSQRQTGDDGPQRYPEAQIQSLFFEGR